MPIRCPATTISNTISHEWDPLEQYEVASLSKLVYFITNYNKSDVKSRNTLLFKSNGNFFLRWQNMVFIFKVQTWNFVCGIRRSLVFTMENILSVWYTATPGWTSKFGKVWKTRCQNAATRANIWRCFLVSWDDKYLWVMVSNNRHELYFVANYYAFPVYIVFLAKYGI